VLAVLGGPEEPATVREIGDRLATDGEGPPLKKRTILDALDDLLSEGLVDGERPGSGLPSRWWRTP
jgi:DNA-binding PadR family transcriptional regulator